ncbi:hypothetical protein KC926_02325 [Candidatus Kaiserbacteria bacterium]|nr:hypothetical protein [Candidatus Kaiserbacteria bacterium]
MIKNNEGFIALTSVLILSAIFLFITVSMATRAITVSETSVALRERDTARYLARGCVEYARLALQRTLDYRGDEVIIIGDDSCNILEIEGEGKSNRVVKVEVAVGMHSYLIEEVIEEVSPVMKVTSSERVIQF